MTAKAVSKQLSLLADPEKAEFLQRFFKTGPGEYAEGDRLLGISVPKLRQIARQFKKLALTEVLKLLKSKWHEERLTALFILVGQFERGTEKEQKAIYRLYLEHTEHINNWDLVDGSAHQIVGGWLFLRSRRPLYNLARSKSLWDRRIAIIATYHFIKRDDFDDTLKISEMLLNDEEDLIHKANGWMLREVGNRNRDTELRFLKAHAHRMPRTMLRYAIEKFPENLRKQYLTGSIRATDLSADIRKKKSRRPLSRSR